MVIASGTGVIVPRNMLRRLRILKLTVMVLALAATLLPAAPVRAQGDGTNTVTQTIVGQDSKRVWKVRNDGVEQGTAWYQPGFNDNPWTDTPVKFYARRAAVANRGRNAYYFREEFEITDVHQITELKLKVYYDDAVVMYMNGNEVYRTIRNNLPSTDEIPVGGLIPVDYQVLYGGAENYYVNIPATENYCEKGCTNGGATTPIDVSLLEEGTNVFGAMVWTRWGSDLGFDLAIDVVRDLDAPLSDEVVLSEVVASNSTETDEDMETPDWLELYNRSEDVVSLAGWRIEDQGGSWTFPDISIQPGHFLRVWASDKDRAPTDGGELHTNFKISKEGDSLRLIDAGDIVRDAWTNLPRQIPDVAYGRADNGDTITYLASATPGSSNGSASTDLDPVLRPFSNRLVNVGDTVAIAIDGFDPEGSDLTYSMTGNFGLSVNSTTGVITGTATTVGQHTSTVTIADADGQTASQQVLFTVVEEPTGPAGLVLNEYNAVAPLRELIGGSDAAFSDPVGNGGDWYEFVVVQDLLDLRGWSIELWDRDRNDELGDDAASLTFGDDFALADLPAGALITISEDRPDDLSLDPENGDWVLNLQANDAGDGAMFSVQQNFNSTRSSQHVEIRDASGVLRHKIVGETEAWDDANGGVSGGEVMNLCIDPTGTGADPVTDYRDNGTTSTFGAPNECTWTETDPNNPTVVTEHTFDQDLSHLRDGAGMRGDVNCDNALNIVDALMIAQYAVGNRRNTGSCPIENAVRDINGDRADFTVDGTINIIDALAVSRCAVQIEVDPYCTNDQ